MNYKCVWIVSFTDFFFKYPPSKSILSTAEEISTLLLKLHVAANTFFSFATPHTRQLKLLLLIFCFDILNLKLFDFETEKGKENKSVIANLK